MKKITSIIKGAVQRAGYSGLSISKTIGMPYSTLNYRYEHPETWKLYEIGSLFRYVDFTDSDLDTLRKEIERL